MGTAATILFGSKKEQQYRPLTPLELAIENSLPPYYVRHVEINTNDICATKQCWGMIMNSDSTIPFLEAQRNPDFQHSSVLTWFFDSFYERFFTLSPEARPMFHHITISAQGRLLAGVISSALGLLQNKDQLHKRLAAMTQKHSMKGVKACQYGTMGSALIWAMDLVLGSDFTDDCKVAWTRVYSFLISIIIPVAVEYELGLKSGSASRRKSFSFSESGKNIRAAIENKLSSFHPNTQRIKPPQKSDGVSVSLSSSSRHHGGMDEGGTGGANVQYAILKTLSAARRRDTLKRGGDMETGSAASSSGRIILERPVDVQMQELVVEGERHLSVETSPVPPRLAPEKH